MAENKTILQKLETAYTIAGSLVPQNGKTTDIRDICNSVSEFQEVLDNTGMELRQDGLITYEASSGKTKRCSLKNGIWTWEIIPTENDVKTLVGNNGSGSGSGSGSSLTENAVNTLIDNKISGLTNETNVNSLIDAKIGTFTTETKVNYLIDTKINGLTSETRVNSLIDSKIGDRPTETQVTSLINGKITGLTNETRVNSLIDSKISGLTNESRVNTLIDAKVKAVTPNITVGTVQELPVGSKPTVTISGTYPNLVFNFGIPQGGTPEPVIELKNYLGVIAHKAVAEITLDDLKAIESTNIIKPQTVYQHSAGMMGSKSLVMAFPKSFGDITSVLDPLGTNLLGISYQKVTKKLTIEGKEFEYIICGCIDPTLFNNSVVVKFNIS